MFPCRPPPLSSNDDVRLASAKELRKYVERESREMSSDTFTNYMNDLNKKIFDLVNSSDAQDKMGGIYVIGKHNRTARGAEREMTWSMGDEHDGTGT